MAEPLEKVEIKFIGDSKNLTQAIESLDKATKKLLNTQAKIVDFNKKQKTSNTAHRKSLKQVLSQLKLNNAGFKDLNLSTKTWTKALKGNRFEIVKIQNASKKYIATNKKLTATFEKLGARQVKTANTNKTLDKGLLDTNHSTRILGGAFSVLRSKMLLFNFAMGLGIRQLISFVTNSAKIESMSRAFNTLQGGTQNANIAINKLREATDGTMSSFDLFQQANNAMILGVSKNSDEMAEMFDIAQRLGRALGKDTRMSVESLITGIGRQSRLMLDNIGIIVKSDEAYDDYAKKLNTTADKLTDAEKKQAFLEATMTSARAKVESLGGETLSTEDTFAQLSTQLSETSNAIGQTFTPMVLALSEGLRGALIAGEGFFNILNKIIGLEEETPSELPLSIQIKTLEATINSFNKGGLIDLDSQMSLFSETMGSVPIEDATFNVTELGSTYVGLAQEIKEAQNKIKELRTQLIEPLRPKIEFPKFDDLFEEMFPEDLSIQGMDFSVIEGFIKEQDQLFTESANVKKAVEGDWTSFQLEQLAILKQKYEKHHGSSLESDAHFAKLKQEILLKGNEELINALLVLRDNEMLNEMDKLDEQKERLLKAGMDKLEVEEWFQKNKAEIENKYEDIAKKKAEAKAQRELKAYKDILEFGKNITSQLEKNLDSQVTNELEALKETDKYKNASATQRKNMEKEVNSQFAKERKKLFEYNKGVSIAEAMINIAEKIIEHAGNLPMQALIGAMGAVQLKAISSQKAPTYEQGGLVGGRRHSQGGTMIEAEKGEFVMSRSAVESIGVEAMNQINQGGGAGITVNVTAPLVDETVIDSIIPAIEKAQRLNLA